MVSRITSAAITSPAITPCTLTTSYFPVRGCESPFRPPALAYLLPNNCAIFRAGICDRTLTSVASSSITRATLGDMAMQWSEGFNPGVDVTSSGIPSLTVYRVADQCTRGAGKGVAVRHFASTPAEGLTTGDLFVGGTPRFRELTTGLSPSLYGRVQPLAAIAVAFKGRTAAGRPGWLGSVLCGGPCNGVFSSLLAAADSDVTRRRGQEQGLPFVVQRDPSRFSDGGCRSGGGGFDQAAGSGEIGAALADFSQPVILRGYCLAAKCRGHLDKQEIANGA